MQTAEIRRRWLNFFEGKGHAVVPSASLISPDPTLLFTVAGMVPFIPYMTGQQTPPWPRATSVQKCVRTLDIEEVGKTTRHGTFFQMNGNFSFGDYFKEGAIDYAWELVTGSQDDGLFGFDPESIWVTVYEDDDEAQALWRSVAGLPPERIQRRGRKDNYWHTGVPGPGGPCSEIYVDRGREFGLDGGPVADEDRFLEIWNLVFMQHSLSSVRGKEDFDISGDLPKKNIDTGMGLERVAYLLQGVGNLYEIDEVFPVIQTAQEICGVAYGKDHQADVWLRVVADHVRSGLMLIGDGVTPSNEGRGYVLRRLLRRVVRSMKLLGVDEPTFPALFPASRDAMKASYPELQRDWDRIGDVAFAEEEAFRRTLTSGTTILDTAVAKVKSAGSGQLSGDSAFQLHDTYGFPIDLTLEMAEEQGISVDEAGFRRLMTEQRERAQADSRAKKMGRGGGAAYQAAADVLGAPVEFTGYRETVSEGAVRSLIVDGGLTQSAAAGTEIEIILDRTPLYAEGGGQLPDSGRIIVGDAEIEVRDVQSPFKGLIVHRGVVVSGEVTVGQQAQSFVDIARRKSISRAHTATHMVHKAFREALGETATQAGSENSPGRFRFDFHANSSVSSSVMADVESRVNEMLIDDLEVRADIMTQAEAVSSGAMALFGEKYGDEVRVVSVGEWARELCGGTHALRSGQLGVIKLLGESSIGSGVRRVEALVGGDAYDFLAREHAIVGQLAGMVKVRPEELPDRIAAMLAQLKAAEKELSAARAAATLAAAAGLAANPQDVFGVAFIGHDAGPVGSGDDVRNLVTDLRGRLGNERPTVVAAAGVAKSKPLVVIGTNQAARDRGVKAGALVRIAAQTLGGGGGGKDDLAQGGGQDVGRIPDALRDVEYEIGRIATS